MTELASTMTPREIASQAAQAISVLTELTHGGGELSNPGDVRSIVYLILRVVVLWLRPATQIHTGEAPPLHRAGSEATFPCPIAGIIPGTELTCLASSRRREPALLRRASGHHFAPCSRACDQLRPPAAGLAEKSPEMPTQRRDRLG